MSLSGRIRRDHSDAIRNILRGHNSRTDTRSPGWAGSATPGSRCEPAAPTMPRRPGRCRAARPGARRPARSRCPCRTRRPSCIRRRRPPDGRPTGTPQRGGRGVAGSLPTPSRAGRWIGSGRRRRRRGRARSHSARGRSRRPVSRVRLPAPTAGTGPHGAGRGTPRGARGLPVGGGPAVTVGPTGVIFASDVPLPRYARDGLVSVRTVQTDPGCAPGTRMSGSPCSTRKWPSACPNDFSGLAPAPGRHRPDHLAVHPPDVLGVELGRPVAGQPAALRLDRLRGVPAQ